MSQNRYSRSALQSFKMWWQVAGSLQLHWLSRLSLHVYTVFLHYLPVFADNLHGRRVALHGPCCSVVIVLQLTIKHMSMSIHQNSQSISELTREPGCNKCRVNTDMAYHYYMRRDHCHDQCEAFSGLLKL